MKGKRRRRAACDHELCNCNHERRRNTMSSHRSHISIYLSPFILLSLSNVPSSSGIFTPPLSPFVRAQNLFLWFLCLSKTRERDKISFTVLHSSNFDVNEDWEWKENEINLLFFSLLSCHIFLSLSSLLTLVIFLISRFSVKQN